MGKGGEKKLALITEQNCKIEPILVSRRKRSLTFDVNDVQPLDQLFRVGGVLSDQRGAASQKQNCDQESSHCVLQTDNVYIYPVATSDCPFNYARLRRSVASARSPSS